MRDKVSLILIIAIMFGLTTCCLIIILIAVIHSKQTPTNYAECVNKGGVILQTFPEQCSYNNQTFTK